MPHGWFTVAWSNWHGERLLTFIAFNKKQGDQHRNLRNFQKCPGEKNIFVLTRTLQARAYRGVVYGSLEGKGLKQHYFNPT